MLRGHLRIGGVPVTFAMSAESDADNALARLLMQELIAAALTKSIAPDIDLSAGAESKPAPSTEAPTA